MNYLNQWSIDDLQDLLAAKEHDANAEAAAFKALAAERAKSGRGMADLADWMADWGNFWNRWQSAKQAANREILAAKLNFTTPNSQLASSTYADVLRAFRQNQAGQYAKGDFQDLVNRLTKAGAKVVDSSPTPQPKHADPSLALYNQTGAALAALGIPDPAKAPDDQGKEKDALLFKIFAALAGLLAIFGIGSAIGKKL